MSYTENVKRLQAAYEEAEQQFHIDSYSTGRFCSVCVTYIPPGMKALHDCGGVMLPVAQVKRDLLLAARWLSL